jgi:hypothetical protein
MPVFEITAPDGKKYRVTAPEGATQEEALARVQAQHGAAAPAASGAQSVDEAGFAGMAPPAPTRVNPGVQGAGKGLSELAFGIPDMVNTGVNFGLAGADMASRAVGGPELPFRFGMPSQIAANRASEVASAAGFETANPETMPFKEKLAYNVNRFGTQAAGAIPFLVRAGAKRVADVAGGDLSTRWYDPLVRPYGAEASARTIRGDAAGAAGAGAGVTVAQSAVPEDSQFRPLAEAGGAIGGGVGGVGVLSLGEAMLRLGIGAGRRGLGLNNVEIDPTTMQPISRDTFDSAARMVQGEVSPNTIGQSQQDAVQSALGWMALNKADVEQLPVPPTSAAMAENPGLSVLERSVRRSNQGPAIARDRQFQTGVRDTLDQVAPEGATAQPLINRAQQEIDARLGAAQENVDRAETYGNRTEQVRAAHGQDVEGYRGQKPAASAALDQEVVEGSLFPLTEMKTRRYEAVPDTPLPGGQFHQAASQIRAEAEPLPPHARNAVLPNERLADFEQLAIRDDEGNITGFRPLSSRAAEEIRPQISEDIAAARKANAAPGRIDNLRAVQGAINDATANNPAAAEANRFYNEDFAPVYGREAGEAYRFRKDVNKDRVSRTASPRSETAGRFLVAGSPEKTAALERIFTTIPDPTQAQAAARQFLMADLAEKNVVDARTGALRPNALRNWRLKNDNTLGTVPGLQQEVDDLLEQANKGERVAGRFAEELQNARREQNITQDQINRSSLRAVTDVDPESAVAAIMGDPNSSGRRLRELIDLTAGDDAARTGLKAAVRDYLVDKATNSNSEALVAGDRRGPVSSAKLTQIFNKHEAELAQVFSPEEMNTLRAGHRALELQNVNRVRVETGSATQSNKVVDQILQSPLGKGVEAALRVKYGLLKTGGLISTARRLTAGIGKQEADDAMRLVERAAFDPDLMARLLGREIPIGSPRWNARLNTILGVAEGAREEYGTDGQGSKGPLKITVNPAKR